MIYDSLLLPASGVKGYSILGALKVIEYHKILDNIKTIIGISAGAILGLLLSIGYKPLELFNLGNDININTYNTDDNLIINLINKKSLYSTDKIINIIINFLEKKQFSKTITFKEFKKKSKYDLSIIASDITKSKLFIFNEKNTPNVPLLLAIKSTIAIPLIFPPVIYKDSILVDGGIYNYLPIPLITNTTLIINMSSNFNILNSHITKEFDLKNYILLLLNGFIKNDFLDICESYHKINLKIDFGSIDFALNKDEKVSLYLKGIETSYNFFKRKHILKKYFIYWSPAFKGTSSSVSLSSAP